MNNNSTRPRRTKPSLSLRLPSPEKSVPSRVPVLAPRTLQPYVDMTEEEMPPAPVRPHLRIPSPVSADLEVPDDTLPRRANERELPPGSLRLPVLPEMAADDAPRVPLLNPRPAVQPNVELEDAPPAISRPRLAVPATLDVEEDTRPRIADPLQHLTNRNAQLQTMPVSDSNGWLKSSLLGALQSAGQASNRILSSGRRLDGSALTAALGGAAGGFGGGALNSKWDETQDRQNEIAGNQMTSARIRSAQMKPVLDAERLRVDAGYKQAQLQNIDDNEEIRRADLASKQTN